MENQWCGNWWYCTRTTSRGNFYVGVIGRPTEDGYGYFLIDGNEHYENKQYKLLTVRPNCSLAWMPYRAGDTQPKRAVVAGYLSGVGFTYIIQVRRHEVNSMKYGVYVTGDDFAQYPYYGVQYVKDVEILVQVWLISEHPHSQFCAFCIFSSLKKGMASLNSLNRKLVIYQTCIYIYIYYNIVCFTVQYRTYWTKKSYIRRGVSRVQYSFSEFSIFYIGR